MEILTETLSNTIDTNITNIQSNTASITANNIGIENLENNKVSKSGDIMTGTLSMTNNSNIDMGGAKITGLQDPENDHDAATKSYVDRLTFTPSTVQILEDTTPSNIKTIGSLTQSPTYNVDILKILIIADQGFPKIGFYDLNPDIYNGATLTVISPPNKDVDVYFDLDTNYGVDEMDDNYSFRLGRNYIYVFTYYNYNWYYSFNDIRSY